MKEEYFDKVAVVLTVIMFLVFLSTLSISLDDEDSVHFALGLRDFNVTKYQPHPPGFPVYMAIGMIFNTFLGNEILALTLMSALFGALSVFVFYVLVKHMFRKDIALFASVLMAITPLFWLNSIKAMSDMAGLFFILLSMLLIYRYSEGSGSLYLYSGAIITGISIGVRIHSAFILLPMMLYALIRRNGSRMEWLKGGSFFLVAILAWLIPLLMITGVTEYLNVAGNQFSYRIDNPDISSIGSDVTYSDLTNRFISFFYFFLLGGYGINVYSLGILSGILLLLMVFLVLVSIRKAYVNRNMVRDDRIVFFLAGLAPYLAAVFLMLPPFNPRYLLVLVPLLSIWFVSIIQDFNEKRIRHGLYLVMLFLILSPSVLLASVTHTVPSPPSQMVYYADQNYGEGDGILMDGFALKYFIYYGIDMIMIPNDTGSCSYVRDLLTEGKNVITTFGAIDCIGIGTDLVMEFHRDSRVHIKRSKISLHQLFAE